MSLLNTWFSSLHGSYYPCYLVAKVMSNSFVTFCTIACQALLSMGFPRQEYCTGLPCLPQGILRNQCRDLPPVWQTDSLPLSHLGSPLILLLVVKLSLLWPEEAFQVGPWVLLTKNRRVLLAPLISGRTSCCRLIFPMSISCFKKPWFLLVSSGISRSQQK